MKWVKGVKRQTSSYKISKLWGCYVQDGNYINNIVYLKVSKRIDLKSSHLKKKIQQLCMLTYINCDHFTIEIDRGETK